jgi:DNA polymerase III alpha subunit (gram-positive type)
MFLAFDIESGGLGKEVSLLTAYFAVLDKDLKLIDELDLNLIPDDGIYRVQPQGLTVNKINLIELAEKAIPYKDAKTILYKFLEKNRGEEKLIPLGQNVQFDVDFIVDTIISKGSLDNFVSHRALDTMLVARFLQLNGRLPVESVSLGNLIEYFGIQIEGNAHEARYDTLATVEVYKRLVAIVSQPALASVGGI